MPRKVTIVKGNPKLFFRLQALVCMKYKVIRSPRYHLFFFEILYHSQSRLKFSNGLYTMKLVNWVYTLDLKKYLSKENQQAQQKFNLNSIQFNSIFIHTVIKYLYYIIHGNHKGATLNSSKISDMSLTILSYMHVLCQRAHLVKKKSTFLGIISSYSLHVH